MTDQEVIKHIREKARNHYTELMWYIQALAAIQKQNVPMTILADDSGIEEFIYEEQCKKEK